MENTFRTSNHRCSIRDLNVQISDLGDEDGLTLQFSHKEALEFAHALLAHAAELEARQATLEAQFSQLSLALIDLFAGQEKSSTEAWQREIVYMPNMPRDFNHLLSTAYKHLKQQKAQQVQHWYQENEEQEVLFWLAFERYFYEQHRDDLIEKYFPEEE